MRFRRALLAICAACVAAGVVAELSLVERTPPAAEQKLKERARFGKGHLLAVLARRAPRLGEELRDRLADAVMEESARAGYDPLFVLSLVAVESDFRVRAQSERGARGLVQMKPSTFAWISAREPEVSGDALLGEDPVLEVRLAVRYVRWLEKRFKTRDGALMAYNAGPRRARLYLRSGEPPDKLLGYVRLIRREHERLAAMAELTIPLPELPQAATRRTLLASTMRFDLPATFE